MPLGTGSLAYSFALRRAFDADRIAAIENVTRKLMRDGRRAVRLKLEGDLWDGTGKLKGNCGVLGSLILASLAVSWPVFGHELSNYKGCGDIDAEAV